MTSLSTSYKASLPYKKSMALSHLKQQLSVRFAGGGTGTGGDNNDSVTNQPEEGDNYLDRFLYQGSLDSDKEADQTPEAEKVDTPVVENSKSTYEPGKKWKRRERKLAEALFNDIANTNIGEVLKKLKKGVRLDYVNESDGCNFLTMALYRGAPDIINALLQAGMDVDAVDGKGRSLVSMIIMDPTMPAVLSNTVFNHNPKKLNLTINSQHGLNRVMEQGRTDVFKKMLDAGAKLNVPGVSDAKLEPLAQPPLISAILQNKPLEFDLMMSHVPLPDVMIRGHQFITPLHASAMANRVRMAEKLLATGASLDVFDKDGDSPFHQAIKSGISRAQDVTELLGLMNAHQSNGKAKTLVDQKNTLNGNTALHMAFSELTRPIESGSVDPIVDLKIKMATRLAGKLINDLDANVNIKNDNGETPLMIALDKGMWEGVDLLLANPALDLSVKDNSGLTALERFELKAGLQLPSLVAYAASADDAMFARLKRLDELGIHVPKSVRENTASRQPDDVLVHRMNLTKHGTLPEYILNNTFVSTDPLYTALQTKNHVVAKWLLDRASNDELFTIYTGADHPKTLLSLLALDNSVLALDRAKTLLEKGLNPLRPAELSALSQAVRANNLPMVKLFTESLTEGIDASVTSATPVFYDFFYQAISRGMRFDGALEKSFQRPEQSYAMLTYLAEHVQDINALDNNGKHALQYAVEIRDWKAFDILIDHGADLTTPVGEDKTLLDQLQAIVSQVDRNGEPVSLTEALVSAKQFDLVKRLIREQDLLNLNSREQLSVIKKDIRHNLKPELLQHHKKLYLGKATDRIADVTNLMKELIDTNSDVTDWVKAEPRILNEQMPSDSYMSSLEYALRPNTLRAFHTLMNAGASVAPQSYVTGRNLFHMLPYWLNPMNVQNKNSASKAVFDRLKTELSDGLETNPLNVPDKQNRTPFESLLNEACVYGDETLARPAVGHYLNLYIKHGAELRASFIEQAEAEAKQKVGKFVEDTNIIALIEAHGYADVAKMLLNTFDEPALLKTITHNTLVSLLKNGKHELFVLILEKAKEQNITPVLSMIRDNASELLKACLDESGDKVTPALKTLIAFEPELINSVLTQAPFLLETARNKQYRLTQFAMDNNADLSVKSNKGFSLPFILIKNLNVEKQDRGKILSLLDNVLSLDPSIIHQLNPYGHTLIMSAVQAQDFELVKKLVEAGSDFSAITTRGKNIKDFVERFHSEESGTEIADYLERQYPADLDAQIALRLEALNAEDDNPQGQDEKEEVVLNRPDGRPTEAGRQAAIEALKKARKELGE